MQLDPVRGRRAAGRVAAARDAGLATERGEVVAVAANVLVRLEPGPIAARMSGATAAAAGDALRACHDALLGVDATPLRLEPLGMLHEARRLAATGPADVAHAVEHALEMLHGTSNRIVHGDSHPGNVLWTADGPLWSDWEDTHLAPLEWDLACLVARARLRGDDFGWAETALRAHGGPHDAELLEVCVNARVAQGAAYLAFTGRGGPDAVAERLAWLRRIARSGGGHPRSASGSAQPEQ
jgi:hypothetical protein